MGLRIGTNVASLAAQNRLAQANQRLGESFLRLASGRRVINAGDDAPAVAISARLTRQIRSVEQASRNANDGIALLQQADSALAESDNVLQRLRELAVQSQNGTISATQRTALDTEFNSLVSQLDSIANGASFNGIGLLNSSTTGITLQVGPDTGSANTVSFTTVNVQSAAGGLTLSAQGIDSAANASTAIGFLDSAIDAVANNRATLGAALSAVETAASALTSRSEALQSANSRIIDVDVARETAEVTRNSVLQQAALAVLAQANAAPTAALALL